MAQSGQKGVAWERVQGSRVRVKRSKVTASWPAQEETRVRKEGGASSGWTTLDINIELCTEMKEVWGDRLNGRLLTLSSLWTPLPNRAWQLTPVNVHANARSKRFPKIALCVGVMCIHHRMRTRYPHMDKISFNLANSFLFA